MIDWSKQHCGVHHGTYEKTLELMPDLKEVLETFPYDPKNFMWDVKVHMLFPGQYPCIPNWHCDFVPRVNGIQQYNLVDTTKPMYLWVSGAPLTQFKHGFAQPQKWIRFTQLDEHRGMPACDFLWRGFIRAVHIDICKPSTENNLRRHCQVYLNADTYQW